MEPPFDLVSSFDNDRIRKALSSSIDVPPLYRDLASFLEYTSLSIARRLGRSDLGQAIFDQERDRYSLYPHPTRGVTIGRATTSDGHPAVLDFLDGLDTASNAGGLLGTRVRLRVWKTALSAQRTAARREAIIDAWNPPSPKSVNNYPAYTEEELRWLRARLAILQDFEREVIRLYDVQHLTYTDIAQLLNSTYARVQKARLHAFECMSEEAVKAGFTLSGDKEY